MTFFSTDDCQGTGDHENYFENVFDAFERDGTRYKDCKKLGVSYRSKLEHKPLSSLIKNNVFLRDDVTGQFSLVIQEEILEKNNILDPKIS